MDSLQEKPCTNPEILRRLSYIKYLFQIAVNQSSKPEPLGSFSILTFHDSVEMFLQLSAEYLEAKKSENIQFIKYWDVINAKLPSKRELSHHREMDKFNRARVNLKHYGNLIPKDDIEGHKIVVSNFFQINTNSIFGLEFENISLVGAVSSVKVKNILSEAEELVSSNQKREALIKIAYAYEILFSEYNSYKPSPTYFRRNSNDIAQVSMSDNTINYSVRKALHNLERAVARSEEENYKLNHRLNLIELGIDMANHTKFIKLTPEIAIYGYGENENYNAHFNTNYSIETNNDVAEKVLTFCLNYVIQCALLFQNRLEE